MSSIQSHLFTNTIIYNYTHEINHILRGKSLMNIDNLTKYFLKPISRTSHEFYSKNKSYMLQYFFLNIHRLEICQAVDEPYLTSVLRRSINNENFDFAFIFSSIDESMDEFLDESTTKEDLEKIYDIKMKTLVSFIIVERNECKKYGNAYALNYICSKEKGIGSILVGLYLYSIFSHPPIDKSSLIVKKIEPQHDDESVEYYGPKILHMGILELSGGYMNTPALCLYSKFGFIEDEELSGPGSNCFRSTENIAMRTDYHDMTPENIKEKVVNIILGRESEFIKPSICRFKDPEMQAYLAWLYGLKKKDKIEYNKLKVQSSFVINKVDGILKPEFKEKLDLFISKLDNISTKIMEVERLPSETTYSEYKSPTAMGKKRKTKKKRKTNRSNKKKKTTIIKKRKTFRHQY